MKIASYLLHYVVELRGINRFKSEKTIAMDAEDVREARRLVRTYSLEVAERLSPDSDAFPLGGLLRHNVDGLEREDIQDPWRKFFEPVESSTARRRVCKKPGYSVV